MTIRRLTFLFLFSLCLSPFQPLKAESIPAPRQKDEAVRIAREGRLPEAVSRLEELHRSDPRNEDILWDLLTVLHWAGEDRRVLELSERLDPATLPLFVGEAAARSARNLGEYERAAALYRSLRGRYPGSWTSGLGLALTLSDAGRSDQGLALIRDLSAAFPDNPDLLLGAAVIHHRRGAQVEVLDLCDRVASLRPGDREAVRLRVLALAGLGAPFVALEQADKDPAVLSEEEQRRLRGDRSALAVQWGPLPFPPSQERFAATDRALAFLRQDLDALPQDDPARVRARFDRMIALRDRAWTEEVVAEHRELESRENLPPYLLKAAADAHLHERRPEEAAALYRQTLEGSPHDFEARLGLFHALIESEKFDEAFAEIDALAADEPVWRWGEGLRDPRENRRKEAADSTAAMARAYAGFLPQAQQLLEPMVEAAPFNSHLREKLAAVYRWRGWPERALEEYRIAQAQDPDNLQLRIGLAAVLLDLKEYESAEPLIRELRRNYPENLQIADLAARWDRYGKWQLTAGAAASRADESTVGSRDLLVESRLYAPPIGHRLRPFLLGYYHQARFPEGTADYRRIGAGIEYDARRGRVIAEIDGSADGEGQTGFSLDALWRPDDFWSTGLGVATFSTEVPLRARLHGIDGSSARVFLTHRWSERRLAHATAGLVDMSDGNVRKGASLSLEQRLATLPRFILTGIGALYVSANSRGNAPYFNPEQDLSATLTAVAQSILFRRYDHLFLHRFIVGGGLYQQKDFGTHPVASLGYEQQWQPGGDLNLRYGASWASNVYDGVREGRTSFHLDLDWRF